MEEKITIKKYASLPRAINKAMLCKISPNILSSTQPNALYSMCSIATLKSALCREKKTVNLLPPLPKTL
jgi:hypothetical protein